MKFSALFLICSTLFAEGVFDSENELKRFIGNSENFYEFYLGDQKDLNASVNLDSPNRKIVLNPPALPSPPSNPPTPPTGPAGYLPFVIVNNSGVPDSMVYISVIGAQLIGTTAQTTKMYVSFAGGTGSYNLIAGSGNVPSYALTAANFVDMTGTNPHTWAFYIPDSDAGSDGISGARVYVQLYCNNSLITYSGGDLSEPSVLNQSLDAYSICFDKFEFAYVPSGSPQIAADGTAVDFFSIPLYGYLSTPDAGSSSNSGLYESQSFIMKTIIPYFFDTICSPGAILNEWNKLYSPTKASPIRVLSPGLAMSLPSNSSFPSKFDSNYFDNKSKYGFSLLEYIWTGSGAYYKSKGLTFSIPVSNVYPAPYFYTASINPSTNVMNFTPAFTTEPAGQDLFPVPTMENILSPSANGPTSYLIASAQNLNPAFAEALQGNQVSKLFEQALMVGLLPSAPTAMGTALSDSIFNDKSTFYLNYNVLPAAAGAPWYSVYAQAIHYAGNIYAFGFDDAIYTEVLMQCTTPTFPATFIGITIGECDLAPTTCP